MGVIGYNLQHAVLADRAAVSPNVGKYRGEQGDSPRILLFGPISSLFLVRGKSGLHPTGTGWYKNLMEIRLWKEE